MPRKWTNKEIQLHKRILKQLYVHKNLSIQEVAQELNIAPQTVYQRLKKVGLQPTPEKKPKYCNKRSDHKIPNHHSKKLAEFLGIMFGDGHITHFQTMVTLGNKEEEYTNHVAALMKEIFNIEPSVSTCKKKYVTIYIGSVEISSWLRKRQGLSKNKVLDQIQPPRWVMENNEYIKYFLRGFFDTDGSIYTLRYGVQMSFTNKSIPLLNTLQIMLERLNYKPSAISGEKIYLTNQMQIKRFFQDVQPKNSKHVKRFKEIYKE